MKKVLSLLVIFVFLNVQSWALSGGPTYVGSSTQAVTGTYSGVLVPVITPASTVTTAATVGVFSLGIPSTEASTVSGAAIIFYNGQPYNTIVSGIYDPGENKLTAILEGVASYSVTTQVFSSSTGMTTSSSQQFNFYAQGNMTAQIDQSKNATSASNGVANSTSANRLDGTATVDIYATINTITGIPNIQTAVTFTVDGFLQSSTYSAPTITVSQTGTGS